VKFTLHSGLFPFHVCVWLGAWDRAAIERWLRREGLIDTALSGNDPEGGEAAITFREKQHSLLWMPSKPQSAQDIAILSHEAVHCAINAANGLGFDLSDSSEEFYCYVTQWVVQSVLEKSQHE
jgi:hypothetical protein